MFIYSCCCTIYILFLHSWCGAPTIVPYIYNDNCGCSILKCLKKHPNIFGIGVVFNEIYKNIKDNTNKLLSL